MISHKLLATVNFKPPPPSHFKYLFLKVITFFMWLSSWFGHYYSKTQQMTHKHQNAKFFGGQGNHRFLSNFLNTPCNSEFQTTPPLTFQIFISESNHIFTLAFEQSCFLSFLIQGKLTTDKEKAAQFNDLTKKQGSLYGLKSPSHHHRQWVHRRSHLIS